MNLLEKLLSRLRAKAAPPPMESFPTDDEVILAIKSVPKHHSANLAVDLGNTCVSLPSFVSGNVSGQFASLSGVAIGLSVDLLHADTYCNLYVAGVAANVSGPLIVGVQTSDADTSGTYTDPTSGLAAADRPTAFQSGGVIWINSGSFGGIYGSGTSGQFVASGFCALAAFQRVGRFARVVMNSGFFVGQVTAGFIAQSKITGSGGGTSQRPGSGSVSV